MVQTYHPYLHYEVSARRNASRRCSEISPSREAMSVVSWLSKRPLWDWRDFRISRAVAFGQRQPMNDLTRHLLLVLLLDESKVQRRMGMMRYDAVWCDRWRAVAFGQRQPMYDLNRHLLLVLLLDESKEGWELCGMMRYNAVWCGRWRSLLRKKHGNWVELTIFRALSQCVSSDAYSTAWLTA